ncbi:hypothetical protein RF11_13769 [Thelohanellus kitauei]|uniref:Uncharacterized protein n=1 Tax=Thelohanellus kitauei TaxID=669202 RepID=A0A0C2JBT3_THEKT|nr:hypothetical protein RF11_13769 [Thelohanellus kitauei]
MSNLIHAEEESTSITKNVVIGISVSLIANMMIALSFVAKKYGLIRTLGRGQRPMATGEILNFVSYMFAPAIIITPLSSLSITASEKIYRKQILGCALILGGTMILIIITPRSEDTSLENYGLYVLGVGVTVFTLIKILSLKKYKRSLMAHVFICSILGTITISSCKSHEYLKFSFAVGAPGHATKLVVCMSDDRRAEFEKYYSDLVLDYRLKISDISFLRKCMVKDRDLNQYSLSREMFFETLVLQTKDCETEEPPPEPSKPHQPQFWDPGTEAYFIQIRNSDLLMWKSKSKRYSFNR